MAATEILCCRRRRLVQRNRVCASRLHSGCQLQIQSLANDQYQYQTRAVLIEDTDGE